DTPVRWHQSGGDPHLVTPLSAPPVSTTHDTASDRDGPGYRTESAIIYAGFHGLSTAPSQTACQGHQRWGTFYNNRGQIVISPSWLAVSLWTHRQGDACACRMRPLLPTFVAGWLGRCYSRPTAERRIGLGTSRSRLSSDDRLGFAAPSVGSLHGFLRRAYLIFYCGTTLINLSGSDITVFFNVCRFFFRCHAHAASRHLVTDDRHVRWHQSGGDPRLATPLATPPVSSTRDTASDRDGPRYRTESAITYADFRGLLTAPSQTACPGHQRWDTFYNSREQTVISLPWLAVSLWSPRQVYAVSCRMRPLLHTSFAA